MVGNQSHGLATASSFSHRPGTGADDLDSLRHTLHSFISSSPRNEGTKQPGDPAANAKHQAGSNAGVRPSVTIRGRRYVLSQEADGDLTDNDVDVIEWSDSVASSKTETAPLLKGPNQVDHSQVKARIPDTTKPLLASPRQRRVKKSSNFSFAARDRSEQTLQ